MKSQQPSVPKQKRTQISFKNHPKSKHSHKAHGNFTGTLRLSLEKPWPGLPPHWPQDLVNHGQCAVAQQKYYGYICTT